MSDSSSIVVLTFGGYVGPNGYNMCYILKKVNFLSKSYTIRSEKYPVRDNFTHSVDLAQKSVSCSCNDTVISTWQTWPTSWRS